MHCLWLSLRWHVRKQDVLQQDRDLDLGEVLQLAPHSVPITGLQNGIRPEEQNGNRQQRQQLQRVIAQDAVPQQQELAPEEGVVGVGSS